MLFHVELGLMPLFHGCSVEIKSLVPASRLPRIFWAMLWYFLIPLFAMLLAIHAVTEPAGWSATTGWRQLQCFLALVYSITNFAHLVADIRIPDSRSDQVFLMLVLTLVGLLLNLETWLWWKA
jgi:hypothetical protein